MATNSPKTKSPKELREFGLVMGLVFTLITALLLWKGVSAWLYTFGLGAAFIVLGIFIPRSLVRIEILWMKFGELLGGIMTRVILTAMYLLVITPFGMVLRLCGKKFLELAPDSKESTYWKVVDKAGPASRPFYPF